MHYALFGEYGNPSPMVPKGGGGHHSLLQFVPSVKNGLHPALCQVVFGRRIGAEYAVTYRDDKNIWMLGGHDKPEEKQKIYAPDHDHLHTFCFFSPDSLSLRN